MKVFKQEYTLQGRAGTQMTGYDAGFLWQVVRGIHMKGQNIHWVRKSLKRLILEKTMMLGKIEGWKRRGR